MAGPRFRGVLLCEDKEHERFFRRLLEKKWFGRGKVRVERIPDRQGAGDAWVLTRYAREVRYARSKRAENYAVVVVVDGDNFKLDKRMRQLAQKLEDEKEVARGAHEKIVICIPTRSIETWELWLCGDRTVDEDGEYKQRFRSMEPSVKEAVEAWFQDLSEEKRRVEQGRLPSLTAGRLELERLDS